MKTPKTAGTVLMIIPVLILFFSCASTPYVPSNKGVFKLITLINEGRVNTIEDLTQIPFALDTETLYLEHDVATFWENLHSAGFTMSDPQVVSIEPVSHDTWRLFANSFDMENFFARYTSEDTSLATVETGEGTYYILVERPIRGYPRIRGIKGPIQ